ncbi:MAG TPA: MarR family transcriptional regulator [Candidatus Dormibacteraeota bacterium]|jgi:DNA-binding MarR family transcriptional regulator|nr:MarR family transcriptional regulator [Candidatus Dormibacteraeota bacterium]
MPNQLVADLGTPAEVAGNLRVALMRTVRRLKRETDGEHSVSVVAALASVSKRGPLTLSELAEAEGVSRPSMTVLAANLLEQNLVAREPDERDGRLVRVRITPEGKRVLERSRTRRTAYLAKRLGALSAEELRTLDQAAVILLRLAEQGS